MIFWLYELLQANHFYEASKLRKVLLKQGKDAKINVEFAENFVNIHIENIINFVIYQQALQLKTKHEYFKISSIQHSYVQNCTKTSLFYSTDKMINGGRVM